MRPTPSAILAIATLAVALPAQRKLDARSFLPADYNGEVRVDMKAIVDSGLWDPIERSLFRMLLGGFYDEMGFDLVDVESFRYAVRTARDEDAGREQIGVSIFEGGERVGLARMPIERREGYAVERSDGVEWLHDEWDSAMISPRPGLLVIGDSGVIGAVIRGEARGGVPTPDLLALTAAPGTLALVANVFPPPEQRERYDLEPIPVDWLVDEDPPASVRLRLATDRATGDVQLELLLRFQDGKAGPARMDRELTSWVDALAEAEAPLRGLAGLLEGLETRTDGTDFYASLGLGQPAEAGGTLAMMASLLAPAMLISVGEAEAIAMPVQAQVGIEVIEEEPPEEEPPVPVPVRKKK